MRQEFDRFASTYDKLLEDPVRDYFAPEAAFFVARKLDVLLAFARERGRDTTRATWADVGCGKGELLRRGQPYFAKTMGCDVSAGMLSHCGDLDVRAQVEADRVPFADQSLDWVTAVCTFHHVAPASWVPLAADIMRVLRPGGVFAMIEHNPWNPAVQLIVRRTPVDEHAILLSAARARRVMRDAGLAIAGTRYFLYAPQRLYRWAAGVEAALARVPLGGQYCVFGMKPAGAGPAPR